MKYIISGTNRLGSRTLVLSRFIQKLYKDEGEDVEVIDLTKVGLEHIGAEVEYGDKMPPVMREVVAKINQADGLIVVCPEYNGSMPGALKYFIDHWKYPESYEFRPIALVGLGARFGGLRPVEHLQGVFGFRNAFIYPERVFVTEVYKVLDTAGHLTDPKIEALLRSQTRGFQAFTRALAVAGLDANARLAKTATSTKSP
jgi:chromate reductase, NAD(P)H dehydrogenase (quinone)